MVRRNPVVWTYWKKGVPGGRRVGSLMVDTGLTFADCYVRKCVADFKQFLTKLFESAH